jgi:plasmid stabilization system protein ParE
MTDPVILKKPAARIDLAGCYAYLGERNPEAARRFRLAAEATFLALARMPGTGAPYELPTHACGGFVAPPSDGSGTT